MTALSDAEKAVRDSRARLIGYLRIAGLSTPRATANADHLIAAVRHHDAEIVREFADQEDGLLDTLCATSYVKGIRDAADRINPEEGQ